MFQRRRFHRDPTRLAGCKLLCAATALARGAKWFAGSRSLRAAESAQTGTGVPCPYISMRGVPGDCQGMKENGLRLSRRPLNESYPTLSKSDPLLRDVRESSS